MHQEAIPGLPDACCLVLAPKRIRRRPFAVRTLRPPRRPRPRLGSEADSIMVAAVQLRSFTSPLKGKRQLSAGDALTRRTLLLQSSRLSPFPLCGSDAQPAPCCVPFVPFTPIDKLRRNAP